MKTLTTSEVARQAGVNPARLGYWLSTGKVQRPKMLATGGRIVCLWTEADIERVRVYGAKVRRHTVAANATLGREAADDETV